jgi:hypothetical protein
MQAARTPGTTGRTGRERPARHQIRKAWREIRGGVAQGAFLEQAARNSSFATRVFRKHATEPTRDPGVPRRRHPHSACRSVARRLRRTRSTLVAVQRQLRCQLLFRWRSAGSGMRRGQARNTKSRSAMQIKLTLRQWLLSTLVFGGVLFALASVDARVRDKVNEVVNGGDGLTPWGDRLSDLVSALTSAVRHQSIENAPLLIFAAVGAVLFVFMVRT